MKYNETLTNFKEHLTQLLKAKNISGVYLAQYLGFTKQTISNYKVGKAAPDYETLQKIANILDVSVDELLTGKKPENKPIRDFLGISESSIENIKDIKNNELITSMLDGILSSKKLKTTLEKIDDYYTEIANTIEHFTRTLNKIPPDESRVIIKSIETVYKARISRILFDFVQAEIENYFKEFLEIKKFSFENAAKNYLKNQESQT